MLEDYNIVIEKLERLEENCQLAAIKIKILEDKINELMFEIPKKEEDKYSNLGIDYVCLEDHYKDTCEELDEYIQRVQQLEDENIHLRREIDVLRRNEEGDDWYD
jgi:uncharacterized protein (UPF0335 family)